MNIARHTEITASGSSIDEAIKSGADRASQTPQNVRHVWVKDIQAKVDFFRRG